MLEVKNLKAGYGGVPVIFDVSFNVEEGQIVALLGSNGSGKSTTLKAITGLIKPMGGKIVYNGKDIVGIKTNEIVSQGIAMVPEGRQLFGKLSVEDNLRMGAFLIKDKNIINKRLEQVYNIFPRVKERLRQSAETLSGGEQQMVSIARGMMSEPKLLILDEPSLGLMPKLVGEMFDFIKNISKLGITIILVEQNVNHTLELADYAYVIQNGETVIEGKGSHLLDNNEVKKAYLGL
ncbi:MAG: ABC transporter ATP-binding protein [Peptococcales bacterium]|jgi:branched-chain amino acid transport system ATP-binding protein